MKKRILFLLALAALLLLLTGCRAGVPDADLPGGEEPAGGEKDFYGLTYESTLPLSYASQFSVDYYAGGYKRITVADGRCYLLIPEGKEPPEGLDSTVCRLRMPLDRIYLAATSAMALFDALDGLEAIRLSGARAESWTIENAVAAMEAGDILYAGKYSEPDYELLMDQGCDLAIESTMILHAPKVQEMIETLGVPVFVERSSYESHPLGRTEWIKLYGALLDKEYEAEAFFQQQETVLREMEQLEKTDKTVAFFYLSTDGRAVVRSSSDYVPKMIELAGGRYVFADLSDPESHRSSVPITMEEFYAAAVEADYLIYNTDIDAGVNSLEGLLAKSPLLADFKAVKNGDVWYTGKHLYQATDTVGNFILDVHRMLEGETEGMTFLQKLE